MNCRVLQSKICFINQPYHMKGWKNGKYYDYEHYGIDITDYSNGYNALDYICAHSEGKVIDVVTSYTGQYLDGSYGNYVWIDHGDGWSTLYAHLAYGTVRVKVGDRVKAGQVIAYMDNTGQSYAGHLHFEVRYYGNKLDPESFLNADLPNAVTKIWVQKWHLYDKSGKMLTGWQKAKEDWYYLDKNGIMLTGWYKDPGYKGWFLLASNGKMLTGWKQVNNKWYYMQPETDKVYVRGIMRTGWLWDAGYKGWFLLASSGEMLTGWQKVNGKTYYLAPKTAGSDIMGKMYTGTHVIDGKTYTFDSSGALIN